MGTKAIVYQYLTPEKIQDYISRCTSHDDIVEDIISLHEGEFHKPAVKQFVTEKLGGKTKESTNEISPDGQRLTAVGGEILSESVLLDYFNVDTKKWQVHSFSIRYNTDKGSSIASAVLKPKEFSFDFNRLKKDFVKLTKEHKETKYSPTNHRRLSTGNCFILSPSDAHLGKLDLDQSDFEKKWEDCIDYFLDKAVSNKVARIFFPVHGDFLNVDNKFLTTTKGTSQSNFLSWQDSFILGKDLLLSTIDKCRSIAPTDVAFIPGNHDFNSLSALSHVIHAWYRDVKHVNVECCNSSNLRIYRKWGDNVIGLAHGNELKLDQIPNIFATECADFSSCKHKYFFIGHFHSREVKYFKGCTESYGVQLRHLPSLSGTDDWHHTNGYIGNIPGAQSFIIHDKEGLHTTLDWNFLG